jgi:hypothetical protein
VLVFGFLRKVFGEAARVTITPAWRGGEGYSDIYTLVRWEREEFLVVGVDRRVCGGDGVVGG